MCVCVFVCVCLLHWIAGLLTDWQMGAGMPLYWSINSGLSLDRQMDLQLIRRFIRGLVQDWYWIGQKLKMDWRICPGLVSDW